MAGGMAGGILAALLGAGAQIGSAAIAGQTQLKSTQLATQLQREMFERLQENMSPYMDLGLAGVTDLKQHFAELVKPIDYDKEMVNRLAQPLDIDQAEIRRLGQPITMDQATLEATPGYQFARTQGLKAVQNQAAARGLGSSGAAMKGASQYATGLADQTYGQQFDRAQTNQANQFNRLMAGYQAESANRDATLGRIGTSFNLQDANRANYFNRLMSMVSGGQSAAAGVGQQGIETGRLVGENLIGGGNATAAMWNKMGGALSNGFGDIGALMMMKNMGMQTGG